MKVIAKRGKQRFIVQRDDELFQLYDAEQGILSAPWPIPDKWLKAGYWQPFRGPTADILAGITFAKQEPYDFNEIKQRMPAERLEAAGVKVPKAYGS